MASTPSGGLYVTLVQGLVGAVLGLHAPDPNHNTVARHVVSIM